MTTPSTSTTQRITSSPCPVCPGASPTPTCYSRRRARAIRRRLLRRLVPSTCQKAGRPGALGSHAVVRPRWPPAQRLRSSRGRRGSRHPRSASGVPPPRSCRRPGPCRRPGGRRLDAGGVWVRRHSRRVLVRTWSRWPRVACQSARRAQSSPATAAMCSAVSMIRTAWRLAPR
jgi:hypothetical protein